LLLAPPSRSDFSICSRTRRQIHFPFFIRGAVQAELRSKCATLEQHKGRHVARPNPRISDGRPRGPKPLLERVRFTRTWPEPHMPAFGTSSSRSVKNRIAIDALSICVPLPNRKRPPA
jgi:hypothetical protein